MTDLTPQAAALFHRTPPDLRETPDDGRPRAMVFAIRYHYIGTAVEVVLAHALRLRGFRTEVLLCDQVMPACDHRDIDRDTPEACRDCARRSRALFEAAGLPVRFLSEFIGPDRRAALESRVAAIPDDLLTDAEYRGVDVGKIALASTLRYFLRGRLETPDHFAQFRKFRVTAMMMAEIGQGVMDARRPSAVAVSHGIYVTWGVLADVARRNGARVTVWGYGYRRNSILVSQGETYHRDLLTEPHSHWRDRPFPDSERETVERYLQSRVNGGLDWIHYAPNPEVDREAVRSALNLDPERPAVGLFTNLCWDAAVLFRGAAFPDMYAWLVETVRWALARPELQLVIRCHPAEVRRRSETREKAADVIRAAFPDLPDRIKIVPPESDLSTYTLSELMDLCLVYSSKVGLEFAARGLSVVTAGEAFYREKGFTDDPPDPAAYFERLNRANRRERISEAKRTLCLRYAHHYFFRRHVTVNYFDDHGMGKEVTGFGMAHFGKLAPGRDPDLDRLCDGMLRGKPLFAAEREAEYRDRVSR